MISAIFGDRWSTGPSEDGGDHAPLRPHAGSSSDSGVRAGETAGRRATMTVPGEAEVSSAGRQPPNMRLKLPGAHDSRHMAHAVHVVGIPTQSLLSKWQKATGLRSIIRCGIRP